MNDNEMKIQMFILELYRLHSNLMQGLALDKDEKEEIRILISEIIGELV